ncbi:hypothetical protein RAC89_23065 [Paenibacillus sp. GD4]|uniref:hypothetical protein n=1 Tax=Paenibacillus sp. GD4 TaxID=3068890 RepID=UPI002796D1DD|nr:hypothetical protein [Paenibacillus sp. GD4]MDQ1913281.1 hypothetical protein [Paenibacillus sp. GD4]
MAFAELIFDQEIKGWKVAGIYDTPVKLNNWRYTVIERKGKAVKEALAPDSFESVDERLRRKYSAAKVAFIWAVERAYEDGDLSLMYDLLKNEIRSKAEYYERRYSSKRISRHDFESAFIAELGRLGSRELTNREFTVYEALQRGYTARAIDVVRAETGRRGNKIVSGQKAFESDLLPYNEITEKSLRQGRSLEDEATDRDLIDAMLNEKTLTGDERKLFMALVNDPDASLRELAMVCGFSDHKKTKRTLDGLRGKLVKYNPYT